MKKFYKVSGKMQYILIYITHKYFFWNFILHETFFYTSYNRRESIKYGDCITQEKDITFYPDDRRKYLETYFIFFYSASGFYIVRPVRLERSGKASVDFIGSSLARKNKRFCFSEQEKNSLAGGVPHFAKKLYVTFPSDTTGQ